jgi:hypothetical protein
MIRIRTGWLAAMTGSATDPYRTALTVAKRISPAIACPAFPRRGGGTDNGPGASADCGADKGAATAACKTADDCTRSSANRRSAGDALFGRGTPCRKHDTKGSGESEFAHFHASKCFRRESLRFDHATQLARHPKAVPEIPIRNIDRRWLRNAI